jgi:hypothetical protein
LNRGLKTIHINKLVAIVIEKQHTENYEFDSQGFSKYYRYLESQSWQYDGFMTFHKGNIHILFDTSEFFYIEIDNPKSRKEFQCKNMDHFVNVIKNNTF